LLKKSLEPYYEKETWSHLYANVYIAALMLLTT
jgi:hypothetical protein